MSVKLPRKRKEKKRPNTVKIRSKTVERKPREHDVQAKEQNRPKTEKKLFKIRRAEA